MNLLKKFLTWLAGTAVFYGVIYLIAVNMDEPGVIGKILTWFTWLVGMVIGGAFLYFVVGGVVVLIIWLCKEFIQSWLHGNREAAKSEEHDQQKNHVYFEERITTPLRDTFCDWDDGSAGSDATGYYLPDEGIIRIHHYTYGIQFTDAHFVEDWPASSEEEAENMFDIWVELQEDELRNDELEIVSYYCDEHGDVSSGLLEDNGMELDPDDPEWDWGGSYPERCWDLEDVV